jgi:plasmid stabilization system protein ParE
MEQYKIRIYKKAQGDLEEIVVYLNKFYSETAIKYYDLIISEITKLSTNPKRCALVREEVLRRKGYRYLIVVNYIVFFVVIDGTIQIRRILYNKQQYKDFL